MKDIIAKRLIKRFVLCEDMEKKRERYEKKFESYTSFKDYWNDIDNFCQMCLLDDFFNNREKRIIAPEIFKYLSKNWENHVSKKNVGDFRDKLLDIFRLIPNKTNIAYLLNILADKNIWDFQIKDIYGAYDHAITCLSILKGEARKEILSYLGEKINKMLEEDFEGA